MGPNGAGYPAKRSHKTRWIVIALVVILVLVINATWGWLYSTKRNDFHSQLNNAKQTASDQKSKTQQLASELADSKQRLAEKDKQKPDTQQASSDYREIPELGVKYKLTDQAKDLTYTYKVDNSKNGDVDKVTFSTVALTKFGAKEENLSVNNFQNPCTSSSTPAGMLSRYSPGQTVDTQNKPVEQISDAVKVGDYYFLYSAPQATCSQSKDDSVQQQAIAVAKAAVQSLEPIEQQ